MKRFLMSQPEDMAIEELCSNVSSRLIVDRLYPEDDDTSFNEFSNFTTKQLFTGVHELSKAQDTLKDETGKFSRELQQFAKTLQPTINQLAANQNNNNNINTNKNSSNDNNNNYKSRQNWKKILVPEETTHKTDTTKTINKIGKTISNKIGNSETQTGNLVAKIELTTTTHTSPNLDNSTATVATNSAISSHKVGFYHNQPTYQPCHTTKFPTPVLCLHCSSRNNRLRGLP